MASHELCEEDAAAVSLFATQVGAALEGAECVDELVRREQLAVLGELAAVVAHEVRNPLGTIFNAVALLRRYLRSRLADGPGPGEGEKLLSLVFEEAERLDRIVTDLLDFARPPTLRLESASLREIAEDVLVAARMRPESEGIVLHLEAPSDLCLVELDVRFVRQALLNLVINGMQAMPDGGALTVRARVAGSAGAAPVLALLEVIDTGPGIPANARDRVFEPFFTTKASGTGLGLALVKRAVELHGGCVDLESGAGGTTFSLRLPLLAPVRRTSGRSAGDVKERRRGARPVREARRAHPLEQRALGRTGPRLRRSGRRQRLLLLSRVVGDGLRNERRGRRPAGPPRPRRLGRRLAAHPRRISESLAPAAARDRLRGSRTLSAR
ncbi:MAG: hypothetical protein HYY06_17250 [Deltaproteobacteria bacterium]|nr:hypothetical protein [Deltaproteobacteria bacterium]